MKVNQQATPQSISTSNLDRVDNKHISSKKNNSISDSIDTNSSIDISETAKLLRRASETAKNSAIENFEKVQDLKEKIKSGKYQIDTSVLAEKILDEHLNSDFGKNSI